MNELQLLCVFTLMENEADTRREDFYTDLKTRILTANIDPDSVQDLLDALDGKKREDEGWEEFAKPLTDEEMMHIQPASAEEINAALAQLQNFGHFQFNDDDDDNGW